LALVVLAQHQWRMARLKCLFSLTYPGPYTHPMNTLTHIPLGRSALRVSPIALGTMTFGEQVAEAKAHALLDHAVARGINFIDTAEMYSVPARRETFGATEAIIGNWLAARPGMRQRIVLATKVAGPSRGMPWIRQGAADLTAQDIKTACEGSLKRLRTDCIDLYQIHWPNRNAPAFGAVYFDPASDQAQTSMHVQLQAMAELVREGKVRHIGLSNETPYGLCEFVHLAEQQGLPRVVSVQNPYALTNRVVDNGLDEALHRHQVALLAYSPLAFGALTGKYDAAGLVAPSSTQGEAGRMALFESMKTQRWARPAALQVAGLYNALARSHGLTPTQMALAFCYTSWRVASTIIGVTNREQLDANIDAWGTPLAPELLKAIDAIRRQHRDPAQ
jgi:aryl-alcohol dehydrogenase-like predicted oxidoreductase